MLHGTSKFVLSRGVTQDCPMDHADVAMPVLPLINALTDCNQNWYADDSACAAKLMRLREWFDRLTELGPDFGYYLGHRT